MEVQRTKLFLDPPVPNFVDVEFSGVPGQVVHAVFFCVGASTLGCAYSNATETRRVELSPELLQGTTEHFEQVAARHARNRQRLTNPRKRASPPANEPAAKSRERAPSLSLSFAPVFRQTSVALSPSAVQRVPDFELTPPNHAAEIHEIARRAAYRVAFLEGDCDAEMIELHHRVTKQRYETVAGFYELLLAIMATFEPYDFSTAAWVNNWIDAEAAVFASARFDREVFLLGKAGTPLPVEDLPFLLAQTHQGVKKLVSAAMFCFELTEEDAARLYPTVQGGFFDEERARDFYRAVQCLATEHNRETARNFLYDWCRSKYALSLKAFVERNKGAWMRLRESEDFDRLRRGVMFDTSIFISFGRARTHLPRTIDGLAPVLPPCQESFFHAYRGGAWLPNKAGRWIWWKFLLEMGFVGEQVLSWHLSLFPGVLSQDRQASITATKLSEKRHPCGDGYVRKCICPIARSGIVDAKRECAANRLGLPAGVAALLIENPNTTPGDMCKAALMSRAAGREAESRDAMDIAH